MKPDHLGASTLSSFMIVIAFFPKFLSLPQRSGLRIRAVAGQMEFVMDRIMGNGVQRKEIV
jgi:hypothetical protein